MELALLTVGTPLGHQILALDCLMRTQTDKSLMTVTRHRPIAALRQLGSHALTCGELVVFKLEFLETTVKKPADTLCRGTCVS